jgi:hypothetical protein
MQKEPSPTLDRTACNCLALRQAARHISQIYDSYLASAGLRTTQYSILGKLNRLGPLSINELAKSMVMDRAVASPIPLSPPVMSAIFFLQACSRHFSVIFSRFASFHERAEQRATIFEFHLG